jgi:multiple sugar transport system permease protein
MAETTVPFAQTTTPPIVQSRFERQVKWFPRILLIPTIAYLFVMTVFPLLYSLFISLFKTDKGQAATWVGLANYGSLLGSGEFWYAMGITLLITVVAVGLEVLLGVGVAVLLNRRLRGMGLFRLLVYIPMMVSPLVIGYFWKYMFDGTFGVITYLFNSTIGSLFQLDTPQWLIDPVLATISIIIVDVWQWTPFVALLAAAGLQTIPASLYEAATLDRASRWMQFRRITLPFLATPLLVAILFRSIDTIKIFDSVFILTGGGPGDLTATLSVLDYRVGFLYFRIGEAAAFSWLIVILINIVTTVILQLVARSRRARSFGV